MLLPFLTTDAQPLITAAKDVVATRLTRFPELEMTPRGWTPRVVRVT